jgi:C1A family cysteine protease
MSAFMQFQKTFGKSYSDVEFPQRLANFNENLEKANKLNAQQLLSGGDAVHGVTKFMDLSKEEFRRMYTNYVPDNSTVARPVMKYADNLADAIDWRQKGAVTAVKDQGQCGSCWAFSATEAIESTYFLATGQLPELSAQQITSCDTTDGGCNGGWPVRAYSYVAGAGGLERNSDYPYTSGGGQTGSCQFNSGRVVGGTAPKTYYYTDGSEGQLQGLLNIGPASVCVAADAFQTYRGGVLTSCPGSIDHCVQAVGYDNGNNWWIVRNSWGGNWGEAGYIRIQMGQNLCQIAADATFPKVN